MADANKLRGWCATPGHDLNHAPTATCITWTCRVDLNALEGLKLQAVTVTIPSELPPVDPAAEVRIEKLLTEARERFTPTGMHRRMDGSICPYLAEVVCDKCGWYDGAKLNPSAASVLTQATEQKPHTDQPHDREYRDESPVSTLPVRGNNGSDSGGS